MDPEDNNHKAAGRPDGGRFDRKAGQGSDDNLDLKVVYARRRVFRRGCPPSRWPRRTQGERTPSGFCGTPTASAAAMPRFRRFRPMARHDGVMRKQKRGGEKKPKTTKEGKSKARRIKEKQKGKKWSQEQKDERGKEP